MRTSSRRLFPTLAFLVMLGCADAPDPVAPPDDVAISAVPSLDAALSSPVFALAAAPGGSLVAGEPGGITVLRPHERVAFSSLPNVTGLAPRAASLYYAITGGRVDPAAIVETDRKLYRVTRGHAKVIANLWEFELTVNPDQIWNTLDPDSNPFDITPAEGRTFLVADAAANDILRVEESGAVDWVAVLTPRLASTAPFKSLLPCGGATPPPPCGLPEAIPAQPVATSVAVGPDGAIYAGELTGFPAEPGISRIWRIAPGSLHTVCPGQGCTLFADGFTSIMDLEIGPDGTLYVVEFDTASWLGVETLAAGGPLAPVEGGRVHACDLSSGACEMIADGLDLPTAVTVDRAGRVYGVENETIPGAATVRQLVP